MPRSGNDNSRRNELGFLIMLLIILAVGLVWGIWLGVDK